MKIFPTAFAAAFLLSVFLLPTAAVPQNREPREVVAAVLRDWPPYYITDQKTGETTGFAIDIMEEVARLSGIKVRYEIHGDWYEVNAAMAKEGADLIPNMGITESRREQYDFTAPYETFRISAFVRKSAVGLQDIGQMEGEKVGVVETNQGHFIMKKRGLTGLQVYKSPEELFLALLSGAVDVAVYPERVFEKLALRSGLAERINTFGPPLQEVKRGIAVRKGEKTLLEKLDTGVQQLVKQPEYQEIFEKWHGGPRPYWTAARIMGFMLLLLALAIVSMLLWRHISILRLNRLLAGTVERLRQSEAEHRAVIETSADGFWMLDKEGRILEVNDAYVKLSGYSRRELLTMDISGLGGVEKPGETRSHLQKVVSRGSERFETLHRAKSGDLWPAEITCAYSSTGEGRFFVFIRDLSDRKQAEKDLYEADLRFREAVRGGNIGLWYWDLAADTVNYSSEWKAQIGYEEGEIPDNAEEFRKRVHPDDLQETTRKMEKAIAEKQESYSTEFRFRHKDGSWRWIAARSSVLTDDKGEPVRVVGSHVDVTEGKLAEQEHERIQAQLNQAQKMESVGRLAGGVAHDYNNMLSVIIGYSEMALEKLTQEDPLHDDLKEILLAGKRSMEITGQLLAFARKQTVNPSVLSLNETLEKMLKMLRALIGEDLDLVWLPCPDLLTVTMDPSQLSQIITNLCINARDAISGVGKVTIETGSASFNEAFCVDNPGFAPGEYALIAVSDNGCGMDAETIENIFEPFFTTKEKGKGTGLGLSTVYGIVKQNKGFIKVYSELNAGTTFKVYLRRNQEEGEEGRDKSLEPPAVRGKETILLVEDEHLILKMAARMLGNLGYHVLPMATPGEAVSFAGEHDGMIHLLMTDVVMPEMNGRDLANALRSVQPGIKVLFMSGYTADVIAHHGVLEKGVNFIPKPFSVRDLATKVREALDG